MICVLNNIVVITFLISSLSAAENLPQDAQKRAELVQKALSDFHAADTPEVARMLYHGCDKDSKKAESQKRAAELFSKKMDYLKLLIERIMANPLATDDTLMYVLQWGDIRKLMWIEEDEQDFLDGPPQTINHRIEHIKDRLLSLHEISNQNEKSVKLDSVLSAIVRIIANPLVGEDTSVYLNVFTLMCKLKTSDSSGAEEKDKEMLFMAQGLLDGLTVSK